MQINGRFFTGGKRREAFAADVLARDEVRQRRSQQRQSGAEAASGVAE
jgi:hypothetical protein